MIGFYSGFRIKEGRWLSLVFLILTLIFPAVSDADYVGSLVNRIFIEPDSIDVVKDGYQAGDVISFILETTPWQSDGKSIRGNAAWMTVYVPPGVEVIGAEITEATPLGAYVKIPAEDTDRSYDGWGIRGAKGYTPTTGATQLGEGYVNEVQQDTGIFYSTDPRTALVKVGYGVLQPTGIKSGPQTVYNQWDYDQLNAFGIAGALSGNRGRGNTPLLGTGCTGAGGVGCTWTGVGSIVAGPDTYYTNDYNPDCNTGSTAFIDDIQCVGPWQRIAYPNSKMGGSGTISPATAEGAITNTSVPTSSGFSLSPSSPLPAGTNAIRFVHGKRRVGELETARITFRITDPVAFINSLPDSFCLDSVGGDTSDIAAKDNPFRYYEPQHRCNFIDATAFFLKRARYVNNQIDTGEALSNGDVVSYEITLTNTSHDTLTSIVFTDKAEDQDGNPSTTLQLIEPGDPLCAWSSYDGDRAGLTYVSGSATTGTAQWNTLSSLPQGETVTLHICARVTGSTLYDRVYNSALVEYDDSVTHHSLRSTTTGTITASISGTVYIDADSSGDLTPGDTGASGVTVSLYEDNNSNGIYDPGTDTLYDTKTTTTNGGYRFISLPPGDYIVVETDPTGWASTGDADNPGGTCGTGNGCNTIGTITVGSASSDQDNNFFDSVPPSYLNYIEGKVFYDADTDGVYDTGETGPKGAVVTLYEDTNGNGVVDAGDIPLLNQSTSVGGDFQFVLTRDGDYVLETTTLPPGATLTTDNVETASFTGTGNTDSGNYFGYTAPPGLSVTKTADKASAMPNDTITYTITVTNTTSTVQTGIKVTDTLPSGLTYTSGSTSATGATDIGASGTLELTPSADTHLEEKNKNNNYGTANELKIKTKNNDDKRPLIKWDLSSIPAGATITSATANFFVTKEKAGVTVNIHRLTTDWTESGATWNRYDGTNNWGTAGGDYNGTSEGSFSPANKNQYVSVDITSLVQGWAAGTYSNYGIILISDSDQEVKIGSSENAGKEPLLTVTYTVPPTVETKTNASGSPNPLTDGNPPNLVLPADGFVIPPGDHLDITFTVSVDNPLDGSITDLINTASATSYESVVPATDDAHTLVPSLESYENTYTTVTNLYYRDPDGNGKGTDTIYTGGVNYAASTSYDVAYYDSQGNLVYTDTTATSDPSGNLHSSDPNTNDNVYYGTWTAVVLPDGTTPAATLSAQLSSTDPMVTDTFSVVTWAKVVFTDSVGNPVLGYDMSSGSNTAYITVYDRDENHDPSTIETITITVTDPTTGDSETLTLYETGADTGVFANDSTGNRLGLPLSTTSGTSQNDGTLYVTGGYNITASYTDSDDTSDTASDEVYIPTRLILSNFSGYALDGKVYIVWETDSEIDTVGFQILRENPKTGRYEPLSEGILPALITSPSGGSYSVIDPEAMPGGVYNYKLIEFEGSGKRYTYGPFRIDLTGSEKTGSTVSHNASSQGVTNGVGVENGVVTATTDADTISIGNSPSKGRNAVTTFTDNDGSTVIEIRGDKETVESLDSLSYTRKPHRHKLRRAGRRHRFHVLSGGSDIAGLKIPVKEDGIYRLSAQAVGEITGISTDRVSRLIKAGKLKLTNKGRVVRYLPVTNADSILFFGTGSDSIFTDSNIYNLTWGNAAQIRKGRVRSRGGNNILTSFRSTVHAEKNLIPATGLYHNPESDFFLWDYLFAGQAGLDEKSFTVQTPAPAGTGSSLLTIRFMGATEAADGDDHLAQVSINGTDVGSISWKGKEEAVFSKEIDNSLLNDGENTVTIKAVKKAGVPYSIFFLDEINIEYQRRFVADSGKLIFTPESNGVVNVSDFSSPDIIGWDITNPSRPVALPVNVEKMVDGRWSARLTVKKGHRYIVSSLTDGVINPNGIVPDNISNLRSAKGAEYIVITSAWLKDSLKPLIDLRNSQGLSVMLVDIEDIYDEFNYGIRSPYAIKEFLKWTSGEWRIKPRYIVLAGEGSYDYRNYLGNDDSIIPPLLTDTPYGLIPSDNILGDTDDDGIPEIIVGRLPVQTPEEVSIIVEKIKAYETSGRSGVLALSDNPDDGGNFPDTSLQVNEPLVSIFDVTFVSLASMPVTEARSMMFDAFSNGINHVNFTGHAGVTNLTDEGLFRVTDISALPGASHPLFVGLTCVVSNFALPGFDGFGETYLIDPHGGSGLWSASGMSLNEESARLGRRFYEGLYNSGVPLRVGDAISNSFTQYMANGGSKDMVLIYNFLGDPAMIVP